MPPGLEPGRAYDVRVLAATRVGYQNVTRGGGNAQWVQQRMPERSPTAFNPGPRPPRVHLAVANHTTILVSRRAATLISNVVNHWTSRTQDDVFVVFM